jgi:hypothetical protein
MAKATLLLRRRLEFPDGGLVDVVLWKLPHPSSERPHGFEYRLYYGDGAGNCLVRYDNERGKGDHRHLADDVEEPYIFESLSRLLTDFLADVERARRQAK